MIGHLSPKHNLDGKEFGQKLFAIDDPATAVTEVLAIANSHRSTRACASS